MNKTNSCDIFTKICELNEKLEKGEIDSIKGNAQRISLLVVLGLMDFDFKRDVYLSKSKSNENKGI